MWASCECISKPWMDVEQRGFDLDFIEVFFWLDFIVLKSASMYIKGQLFGRLGNQLQLNLLVRSFFGRR